MTTLRAELEKLADEKYRAFSAKLLPKTEKLIGVRIPELRKLAKRAAAENWDLSSDDTFEETMVAALALARAEMPLGGKPAAVEKFLPRIKNWSVCDSFCAELKIAESEKAHYFALAEKYIESKDEFLCRFAYVMLLEHFTDRRHLESALLRKNGVRVVRGNVSCKVPARACRLPFVRQNARQKSTANGEAESPRLVPHAARNQGAIRRKARRARARKTRARLGEFARQFVRAGVAFDSPPPHLDKLFVPLDFARRRKKRRHARASEAEQPRLFSALGVVADCAEIFNASDVRCAYFDKSAHPEFRRVYQIQNPFVFPKYRKAFCQRNRAYRKERAVNAFPRRNFARYRIVETVVVGRAQARNKHIAAVETPREGIVAEEFGEVRDG